MFLKCIDGGVPPRRGPSIKKRQIYSVSDSALDLYTVKGKSGYEWSLSRFEEVSNIELLLNMKNIKPLP